MNFDDIVHIVFEGLAYDIIKYFVGPVIITLAATIIMKKAFHKLTEYKETVYFVAASFIGVCTLFYFIGATKQGPLLTGGIQSVITGSRTGEHNTIAVIALSIVNTGSMQTVVTNWSVQAETTNGVKFNGYIIPRPGDLTFNTSGHGDTNPDLVTYKAVAIIYLRTLENSVSISGGVYNAA